MPKALTDLAVRNAKPESARREIPDGRVGGLYLILQPSGAKAWAVRYRFGGRSRKFTLGNFPAIDLGTARNRALQTLGEIAGGQDPGAKKRDERAASKAAASTEDLVESVVDDFIRLYVKKRAKRWDEIERALRKDVVPVWAGRRLADIQKKHVVKLIDEIVERGAPIGANRVLGMLKTMFSWALSRGLIDRSPCDGVKHPSPEVERDRTLTNDEISLLWRATEQLAPIYRDLVRLLILTGQRRTEVAKMRWSEIDLKSATWILPRERSKNAREHTIPLAPAAVEILAALPRIEHSTFVLCGVAPPSGFSDCKAQLDKEIVKLNSGAPIPHWVFHDIRRSVATQMAEMSIAPHIVEAVLNHKSGTIRGIAAIYNRYSYAAEKRAALEAWARKLDAILGKPASNVVELAAARL